MQEKKIQHRRFVGTIVSDAMNKTVVVRIDRVKIHPKYRKRFTVSKKFKAHDEQNKSKVGDVITIEECRPYSKDKKWRVIT